MNMLNTHNHVFSGKLKYYSCQTFKIPNVEEEVKLGYRIYGTPKSDGSNVILAPTWLGASSADFEELDYLGVGKIIDTDTYAVIVLDALANGISTSPQTYEDLEHFAVTIEDMVRAQYELMTAHLGFEKVFAIIGISMGGMQAFKWLELYPNYMQKISTIVSAAKISHFDKVIWTGFIEAAYALMALPDGVNQTRHLWSIFDSFVFRSPQAVEDVLSIQSASDFYEENRMFSMRMRIQERIAQMDAIRNFKMALPLPEKINVKLQYIYSENDIAVTPFETLKLLENYEVEIFKMPTPNGHLSTLSDIELVEKTVNQFLAN